MANLITNPDFETNTTGWTLEGIYSRDNGDSHGGSWSVKQSSTTGFANFYMSSGVTVVANTNYYVSFWVKMTSSNPTHVQINQDSAFGTNYLDNSVADTGGIWKQVTKFFNSGAHTTVFVRFYNNNGTVTAYFDDFYMDLAPIPNKILILKQAVNRANSY